MIDAVVNTVTGPAVVHDEADLEGAKAFLVDEDGRCAVLREDGTLRPISRTLEEEIFQAFRRSSSCFFIRMEGRRVRSNRPVSVSART